MYLPKKKKRSRAKRLCSIALFVGICSFIGIPIKAGGRMNCGHHRSALVVVHVVAYYASVIGLYSWLMGVVFAISGCCICSLGCYTPPLGCDCHRCVGFTVVGLYCPPWVEFTVIWFCIHGHCTVFVVVGCCIQCCWIVFTIILLDSSSLGCICSPWVGFATIAIHRHWVVFAHLGLGLLSLRFGFLDIVESVSILSNPYPCH